MQGLLVRLLVVAGTSSIFCAAALASETGPMSASTLDTASAATKIVKARNIPGPASQAAPKLLAADRGVRSVMTTVTNARDMLTLIDGRSGDGAEARGRQLILPVTLINTDLTFEITQLSSKLSDPMPARTDRYSLKQVALSGWLPLSGRLQAMLFSDLAYMKRKVTAVPVTEHNGRTYAARAGLGLADRGWLMTVQYETVGSKARKSPVHRMAEILGGAPLNGEGLAMTLAAGQDVAPGQRLDFHLTGRAMRRCAQDLAIIGAASDSRPEQSAEIGLAYSF